ncbi:Ig-like domain-containing protein [Exiguobacterium artemiae]
MSFDSYLSSPHENTPSMLPSKAPTLTSVYTQKSTSVKGFAEPGSLLNYFYYPTSPYEVGTEQGWIFVDSTGEFEINPIYSGDYTMRLTSIKNGITSEESNTVALDSTPPLSPNVDDVSDQTQEVTGSAEGGAKIIVKKGSEVLGMSDATLHPAVRYERYYLNYNVSISKQVAGTKLNVYAVDLAGNMSAVKEIVVSDKTPPLAPTVDKITDQTLTAKGKAEPGATVSFKSGMWIIGSGLVDREGNFDIPIVVPYAGDILSVSATDTSGNISEITKVLVKDGTAPSSPLINDLTEHSTTVIGWAEPNSTILITSGSSILGTATTSEYGMFEVIIAPQSANTIVTIVAVDAAGNRSKEIQEWVRDITPPEAPKVDVLTDQMTTVSGQTEATAEVTVKVGNKTLGTTQARADGNFTLTIPLQAAGVEVSVVATDQSGHMSEETIVTVKDVTAPEAPKVDVLTDQLTKVSGQTEANAKVTVKVDGKVFGTTSAGTDGIYSLTIPRQAAGVKVSVVATDLAGNTSEETIIIVKDVTAPEAPKVDALTDQMTKVSGQAEVNAKVTVKVDGKVFGTTSVGTDRIYSLTIPRQAAGVKVSVIATDLAGNTSEETIIIVKDVTAPEAPKVDALTDQMTKVSGQAEVNAKVTVKVDGKVFGTTSVGTDRIYSLTIPRQAAGVKVSVIATDLAGNTSEETITIVKDVTAPEAPKVDALTDQMTKVSGQAEVNAKVTVKVDGKVFGTTSVGTDRIYSLTIPRQAAGVKVSVIATDLAGNTSEETIIIVKDVTAPEAPKVDALTDQMTKVSGQAEVNAKVTVKVDGKVFGTTSVGTDRIYSLTIPRQAAGVKVSVIATDLAGNTSEETIIIVKDVTAPEAPKVDALTDQMTKVSGQAEANAKVTVKVNEKVFGTTSAGTDGIYSLTIPRQAAGVKVSVMATDAAGNTSAETTLLVKDVTSPSPPKVYEVTDKAISVSGTAEAGSKILVKIGIKEIGNSIVNSDGTYKIQIAKQKAGVKLTVVAIDHYENISKSTEMIVKDTTPPIISSVGLVSDQSIVVSGKVESNVKVYVKVGSKLIGSALSGKGIYNIKIVKQKAGTKLTVYAVDASGNHSKSKQVTVLDRTPPATPIVNKITNTSKMISGKAESNAKVFVYYNSKKIAEGNADSKGNFKVKIKAQKKGSVLKVYAQDKSSNRSKEKTLKVI